MATNTANKYYEIVGGNNRLSSVVLVINPTFEAGVIRATKIGEWDGRSNTHDEQGNFIYMYRHVPPCDFMIIGNATCTERIIKPFED